MDLVSVKQCFYVKNDVLKRFNVDLGNRSLDYELCYAGSTSGDIVSILMKNSVVQAISDVPHAVFLTSGVVYVTCVCVVGMGWGWARISNSRYLEFEHDFLLLHFFEIPSKSPPHFERRVLGCIDADVCK